jgi:hypothetical protein
MKMENKSIYEKAMTPLVLVLCMAAPVCTASPHIGCKIAAEMRRRCIAALKQHSAMIAANVIWTSTAASIQLLQSHRP